MDARRGVSDDERLRVLVVRRRGLPVAIALTALVLSGAAIAAVATSSSGSHSAAPPVQVVQRSDATVPTTTVPAVTPTTAAPAPVPASASPVTTAPAQSQRSTTPAVEAPAAAPVVTTPTTVVTVTVPDVVGMGYTPMETALANVGLLSATEGLPCTTPTVTSQSPAAGTQVAPGSSVSIYWDLSCGGTLPTS
jgi:hypothetical protein